MKARLRNIFTAKPKKTILVSVIVLLCAALAVTAAGIGPGLVTGKANLRRENGRNIAEIPNPSGDLEDVILPEPGEDCSAVAQLNDGSKINVDAAGNYSPLVDLGVLRNPCPQAESVMYWIDHAGRYVDGQSLSGPVDRLEFYADGFDEKLRGAEILAAQGGMVARVYEDGHYGNVVELDHGNGYTSSYGNCDSVIVKEGEPVKAGQPIAILGSTGFSAAPHLSFWMRLNGNHLDGSLYQFAG